MIGPGQPRVDPGRAKQDVPALDPMRAGPDHQSSGLTLALLGQGQGRPRAKGHWPCPRTVYVRVARGVVDALTMVVAVPRGGGCVLA